jgi:hypothetical protein
MRPLDQKMAWSMLVQYVRPGIALAYEDTPEDRVKLAETLKKAADRVIEKHT